MEKDNLYFIMELVIIGIVGTLLGTLVNLLNITPNEMIAFLELIRVPLHNIIIGIIFLLLFPLAYLILDAIGTIIKEPEKEEKIYQGK